MILNGIKWVFMDMGSTLLDDTAAYPVWFQNASDAIGGQLTAEEIGREYLRGMAAYAPAVTGQLKPYGYTENTTMPLYPHQLERLYPQTKPLLEKLSKAYKLGVIANQSPGAADRLQQHGILDYFAFVLGSADIGMAKPDPRIFKLALEKANCQPHEAVMIGDRPDNDIRPAKRLGLRTIRVRQGAASCQVPKSADYEADVTVADLGGVYEALG